MNILLKYPSRRRHLVPGRIANWSGLAGGGHRIHWLISGHGDDPEMNSELMRDWCAAHEVELFISDAQNKVENFNAGIAQTAFAWDACVLISDDMRAVQPEWDQMLAADFAGELDQGLWYPDGRQLRINTISIFGRPVFERWGWAYHPQFKSVFCDDFYTWLLQRDGKLKYCKRDLVRHEWKVDNDDALMRQTESREVWEHDQTLFERLKAEYANA